MITAQEGRTYMLCWNQALSGDFNQQDLQDMHSNSIEKQKMHFHLGFMLIIYVILGYTYAVY